MLVLAFSILQTSFVVYNVYKISNPTLPTAKATEHQGQMKICINTPPELSFNCNKTLTQNEFYGCQLNGSDRDNNTLTYGFASEIDFQMDENSGYFSVIPEQNDTGIRLVGFSLNDGRGCDNSITFVWDNITVIDVNDPPEYYVVMNTIELEKGVSLRDVYLNNFFRDIDGDILNYTAVVSGAGVSVDVYASSEIRVASNTCEDAYVIFTAYDPYNESDSSLPIKIKTECEVPKIEEKESPSAGAGGMTQTCIPEWRCDEWGVCYQNGTQRRKCKDINGCKEDYTKTFWQDCEYIWHCENGILDEDETGLDCGGLECLPCQTCKDKILNNFEEEIDCGGPNCPPCASCFDGIQNYGESGVDCGGNCIPCPTCSDGIQNQDETGVDCGGPYCTACSDLETPSVLMNKNDSMTGTIIISVIATSAALLVAYRVFRNQINEVLSKIFWILSKKFRKQILLSQEQKEDLLKDIGQLDSLGFTNVDIEKNQKLQDGIIAMLRKCFIYVIGPISDKSLVEKAIKNLGTTDIVKRLLAREYKFLINLETNANLKMLDVMLDLELFRNLLFSISVIDIKEKARQVEELPIQSNDSIIQIKKTIFNAVLALQFNQIEISKKKYIEALNLYNTLSLPQQQEMYILIHQIFDSITYIEGYMKKD